jgi:hypothetical protein
MLGIVCWGNLCVLQVAFNFVPSRAAFMEKVAGKDDPDALNAMQAFIDAFSPVLAEAHKFLVSNQECAGFMAKC